MGVFCFASVVSTASTSVPFPFLGNDFRRAGLPPFLVGVVFSALPAGVLVASPFAQRLSWRFGAKRCVVCGLLAQAAAVALCVLGGESGYVVWGVMRLLQGMAIALESVTMLCVVTRAVPDAVSIAAGLQEVSAGFGTLIGPIIGGYLYDAGGSSPNLASARQRRARPPRRAGRVQGVGDGAKRRRGGAEGGRGEAEV